jgi:DNA-directed RNA polymerase subunit RPC12/RpoP
MPKAQCPHCGSRFDAPKALGGRNAKCTKCGRKFLIAFSDPLEGIETPDPEEWPESDAPAAPSPLPSGRKESTAFSPAPRGPAGIYGLVLAVAVVASAGTAAAMSVLLRGPQSSVSSPLQTAKDDRMSELERRLAEVMTRVQAQQQTIEQLKASPAKPSPPADVASMQKQIAENEMALRVVNVGLDDFLERFRLAFVLNYCGLDQEARNDVIKALKSLGDKKLTWEEFQRLGSHMGGAAGFGCLFLSDLDGIRDCLVREFEAQGDKDTVRLLKGHGKTK